VVDSNGRKEPCIRWGIQISSREGAILWGFRLGSNPDKCKVSGYVQHRFRSLPIISQKYR